MLSATKSIALVVPAKRAELPLSVKVLVPAFKVILPAPELMESLLPTVMPLVSVSETLPPPTSETPVTVTGVAISVKATLPLVVLAALNCVTLLLLLSVVPPTEDVVKSAPLTMAVPLSESAPVAVSETLLLLPAAMLPLTTMAPVLLMLVSPVPD